MIEEYAVDGPESVRLPVVSDQPVCRLLGDGIRRLWLEGGLLVERSCHIAGAAEELRRGRLGTAVSTLAKLVGTRGNMNIGND
jgi:hypothetical protein